MYKFIDILLKYINEVPRFRIQVILYKDGLNYCEEVIMRAIFLDYEPSLLVVCCSMPKFQ